MAELDGRWVTISGRKVFIKEGQSVKDAMAKSGKFEAKYSFIDSGNIDEEYVENEFLKMVDQSYDKLTQEERDLINRHYVTQQESFEINDGLRNDNTLEEHTAIIKALDKACETYEVKQNTASTRWLGTDYLENVYGEDVFVDRQTLANNMKKHIGSEIESKAYTSVSLKEEGSDLFRSLPVQNEIRMPRGTKMYVADNLSEMEAVLGRNTKMKLVDVKFVETKRKSVMVGNLVDYGKIKLVYEVLK